eukprot:CAMPEP_0171095196 /NCGR_PEP_ID=MMETSP0766_2-20121228/43036_1 /TAXON_ID=439317 /ORGANISM="Gambierdiscus australes, Strain CAWD 149" /LENGTH=368 /DNA_ID=CAMNT_0011553977 /DNA_START=163 /DNA_END=1269 /DNA_ORIENTATION=-
MWLDIVKTDQGEGVKPIIECSANVTDAVLKVPAGKKAWEEVSISILEAGVNARPFKLIDDTMMGETYTLEGKSGAETDSVSAVVAPLTFDNADFPCELLAEEGDSESLALSVNCLKEVSQTVLRVPQHSASFPYKPRYYGAVKSGTRSLMTVRKSDFAGKSFVFEGVYSGKRGSSTSAVPGFPFPCTMWLDVVKTDKGRGVKPIIECSASLTDAVLKVPTGEETWQDDRMGTLPMNVTRGPFKLMDVTMMNKTYILEGRFGAQTGSVSATVKELTFDCADFPCELLERVEEESFTLSVECSEEVSQAVLRVPQHGDSYPYHPLYYGTVEAGTRRLMTLRRSAFANGSFAFEGVFNGKRGLKTISVKSM